jgi:hypothetical protein
MTTERDLTLQLGVWRSGSASALHAEGLGFDPLVVHTFCPFCSPSSIYHDSQ